MGVLEAVCLTVVLLLALYGAARFMTWAVWRVLRPSVPDMLLVVTVDERDAELQLRYAKASAERIGVPLAVRTAHPSEELAETVKRLVGEEWTGKR